MIIALVVIIMIVSFVKQLTDRKDPAFYAVMLNASLLDQMTSEQPDFVTDFAEKEGIDLNTSDITFDTSIRIVEDSMDETSITSSPVSYTHLIGSSPSSLFHVLSTYGSVTT